jgi:DNA-binding transcriptional MerR regulator
VARTSRTRSAPELLKISELAHRAGVAPPTIKHYLREGLLPGPHHRTGRTMVYYDARLAERIRFIKLLQEERFLPLRIIAEILAPSPSARLRPDLDRAQRRQLGALEPAIRAGSALARARRTGDARTMTRARVLADMKISEAELEQLARDGLAEPSAGKRPVYRGADLEILEVIDETRRRGLGELFPMAILGPYAAAVRTLVKVELELFRRQVLAGAALPALPLPDIARDATALGERLVAALRAKLVVPELRALAGPTRT